MFKVNLEKLGNKAFPWIVAIVIAVLCVGFKYGGNFGGESNVPHVKDSVSVNSIYFTDSSSLKTVYFESKGKEFVDLLDYFCEKNQNLEIVSITRDASGNPMETIGYKVVVKWQEDCFRALVYLVLFLLLINLKIILNILILKCKVEIV